MNITKGNFTLNKDTVIYSTAKFKKVCKYLKALFQPTLEIEIQEKPDNQKFNEENSVTLKIFDNKNSFSHEGYILEITPLRINISANEPAGIFYGLQTFRQLLPVEFELKKAGDAVAWSVPCLKIEDYPRFSWRGYMLDEARYFHGKEVVKKILDLMALLKLNIFHWHLTDDQGWRIQIKEFPKLTEIGSKREESQISGFLQRKTNGIPHSGHYSQQDIRELISFAKDRFITVIPEIDIPGHTRAAIASYNNLSCRGYSFRVSPHWGIHRDVLCMGKEEVFDFVEKVLKEVLEIFPSNIIHIGGDEVSKDRWKECPHCQSRIKEEHLQDEKELQQYFTNRITKYINSKGKRAMGWNEILDEKLQGDVICQYWFRGKQKVLDYLRQGGYAVMSSFRYAYLDHSYAFTPLKLAYKFEPIPKKLEEEYHDKILGLEALMWAEFIPNINRLEWQTFPRLIAFSEVGWTPVSQKNFHFFIKRLDHFLKRLDMLGVHYANKKEVKPRLLRRKTGLFTLAQAQNGGE
jgi:hexosaminidase